MKLIGKDTRYLKTCRNTNENAKVSQRTGNAKETQAAACGRIASGNLLVCFRYPSGDSGNNLPRGGGPAKCIKEYKGKLRNTKEYPGIPRNTRNTKEYQGILKNTKEY